MINNNNNNNCLYCDGGLLNRSENSEKMSDEEDIEMINKY